MDEVLTIEEARRRLKLAKSTFRQHVLPHLRSVKIGRRRLIPTAELARWLESEARRDGREGGVASGE